MRADVTQLLTDISHDLMTANKATDDAGRQEEALSCVIMDVSAGESQAYASLRDYLARVRMPSISLHRDFLLAFISDLSHDRENVAAKLLPLGATIDTDAISQAVDERRRWASSLYDEASRLSIHSPVVAQGMRSFGDLLADQARQLEEKLRVAIEYFHDGGIYANSYAYCTLLAQQRQALSAVIRRGSVGAFDISQIDLSWVIQHDESWQRKRNRATLERYFMLDDRGNIVGFRLGGEGRMKDLLGIALRSLLDDGAPNEIIRLTPDERYALLYMMVKESPVVDRIEHEALSSLLSNLSGIFSLGHLGTASQLEDFVENGTNLVNGQSLGPVTSLLSFTADDGVFYSKDVDGSVQKKNGYGDWIEFAGPFLGMDLDTHVTTFSYGKKEYRLQTWDGTYAAGLTYGGEIALYARDLPTTKSEQHINLTPQEVRDNLDTLSAQQTKSIFTTYEAVTGSDAPYKKITVNTRGTKHLERYVGKGYWVFLSGFVPTKPNGGYMPGYRQEDLSVTGEMRFEDKGLQDAMEYALKEHGVDARLQEDGALKINWER
ncbi:DUF4474 domain-containing protein [Olsenella massiliensis]|uniref:DUF4474 domain-containing protein n=1 Tax=Olsenella massiliensis TaxID=1622075 RepID=UPI00071C56E6|nr:DUF4474 domain-containing protein [Olsenella massiliensis]